MSLLVNAHNVFYSQQKKGTRRYVFAPFFWVCEKFASCKHMQLRIIVPFKALHFNEKKSNHRCLRSSCKEYLNVHIVRHYAMLFFLI